MDAAAGEPCGRRLFDEAQMRSRRKHDRGIGEPLGEEERNETRGRPVRRGKTSEDRVRLHQDVGGDSRFPGKGRHSGPMTLVP